MLFLNRLVKTSYVRLIGAMPHCDAVTGVSVSLVHCDEA